MQVVQYSSESIIVSGDPRTAASFCGSEKLAQLSFFNTQRPSSSVAPTSCHLPSAREKNKTNNLNVMSVFFFPTLFLQYSRSSEQSNIQCTMDFSVPIRHTRPCAFLPSCSSQAVLPLLFPFFTLTALILNRWIGRTVVSAVAWMLVALTCERKLKSKEVRQHSNCSSLFAYGRDYSSVCFGHKWVQLHWKLGCYCWLLRRFDGEGKRPLRPTVSSSTPPPAQRLFLHPIVAPFLSLLPLFNVQLKSMRNAVPVDYSRAVVRGILRSLPSYNILLNPK